MIRSELQIDIIIPAYNGVKYLPDALSSVFKQTYNNFLIYVIDDGSTDGTEDYIKTIKDKRIRYFKKPNEGVSPTRNYGIRKSNSEFIAFLDCDDLWYPKKLEKQMALMLSNSSLGLVYGSHHIINEYGKRVGNLEAKKRGWVFEDLLKGNVIAGSASMALVRREALNKVGVFRKNLINGEDWELWMRIAKKYEIDFVNEYLAAIRVSQYSAQKNYAKMADSIKRVLPVVIKEFNLTGKQKELITNSILMEAAVAYKRSGHKSEATTTLLELFRLNPKSLLYSGHWLSYGFVLFGSNKGVLRRVKNFFTVGIK